LASAWGSSWGVSWGNSWGNVGSVTPPPVVPTDVVSTPGGGGKRKKITIPFVAYRTLNYLKPKNAVSVEKITEDSLDDVNIVIKPAPEKAAKELDKILTDAVLQQQKEESARLAAAAIEDARNAEIKRLIELDLSINEDEAFILILAQSL
jgi:hypothetical protein